MAKKEVAKEVVVIENGDPNQSILTLSSDVQVILHRIKPQVWDMFEDAHVDPKPPQREAKAAGGVIELMDDPDDEGYKAQLAEVRERRAEHLKMLVFDHTELVEEPDDEVKKKLERYGIPATPGNLLYYSMGDWTTDWAMLYFEAQRLSTVTEEEVQKALDRFRDLVGGATTTDGDGDTEEPVPGEG